MLGGWGAQKILFHKNSWNPPSLPLEAFTWERLATRNIYSKQSVHIILNVCVSSLLWHAMHKHTSDSCIQQSVFETRKEWVWLKQTAGWKPKSFAFKAVSKKTQWTRRRTTTNPMHRRVGAETARDAWRGGPLEAAFSFFLMRRKNKVTSARWVATYFSKPKKPRTHQTSVHSHKHEADSTAKGIYTLVHIPLKKKKPVDKSLKNRASEITPSKNRVPLNEK